MPGMHHFDQRCEETVRHISALQRDGIFNNFDKKSDESPKLWISSLRCESLLDTGRNGSKTWGKSHPEIGDFLWRHW